MINFKYFMLRKFLLSVFVFMAMPAPAQHLVLLHTNDTHSQLDPASDGLGGVLRRKTLIDSIRFAEPNVILVDAGDVVQGSLYYSIYKGEAERKMLNALGYDIVILGNHEFDSGMDKLAQEWKQVDADLISSNYKLENTPLKGMFKPYALRKAGDKKVGFIGINLDPKGMISDNVSSGVEYLDGIKSANALAWYLKNVEGADLVVALTHVGYDEVAPPTPSDLLLAANSENIDIIVGGHSHTMVGPSMGSSGEWLVPNVVGDTVVIAQAGSLGKFMGKIDIDFDDKKIRTELLPIDARYDNRADLLLKEELDKYRNGIDSVVNVVLTTLDTDMPQGGVLMRNWVGDIVYALSKDVFESAVDFAVVNKGGLRNSLKKGPLTKGMIMTLMPFDNKLVVLEISGRDLKEAVPVMKDRYVNCVSKGFDFNNIDESKVYRFVTIDYLADGGDYMEPFTRAKVVESSPMRLDDAGVDDIRKHASDEISIFDNKSRL